MSMARLRFWTRDLSRDPNGEYASWTARPVLTEGGWWDGFPSEMIREYGRRPTSCPALKPGEIYTVPQ